MRPNDLIVNSFEELNGLGYVRLVEDLRAMPFNRVIDIAVKYASNEDQWSKFIVKTIANDVLPKPYFKKVG